MAYVMNAAPLTGGTSRLLKFQLPPYEYVSSSDVYLYYKIAGTSGSNTILQMGVYIEWTRRIGLKTLDSPIPEDANSFDLGYPTSLSVQFNDGASKSIFSFSRNIVDLRGQLLSVEDYGYEEGAPYPYIVLATYRAWIQPIYEGTSSQASIVPLDYLEFVISSTATTKVKLDWTCHGIYGVNPTPNRDIDTFYLSFANAPYINSYPTEIQDTMDSFSIDYYIPDPSETDYISFGILDKTGNLLSGYKIAQKTANTYTFLLSELDKENLYNKFNDVNTAGVQFAVRYKNYDGDPIVVTYPMTFNIVVTPPTIEYTYFDNNSMTTYLTGNNKVMIPGHSNVEFNLKAQAYKGATIEQYYIKNEQLSVANKERVIFQATESMYYTLYAKDSRGNVFTEKLSLAYIPYAKPTCNISAEPPKTDGTMKVTATGLYTTCNFGRYENTYTFRYSYTSNIEENNSSGAIEPEVINFVMNPIGSYTAVFFVPVPNHADTYHVKISIQDQLAYIQSNVATVKSTPVFDWGQNDFNFNVPVTVKGDLIVTGQLIQSDDVDNCVPAADYIIEQGIKQTGSGNSLANWSYRKWNSGTYECWCRKHISTAVSTAWGNLYVSGALAHTNLTWPVTFADIPVANITIAPNASGAFLIAGGSTNLTATTTGGYEIARGSSSSSGNYYINYYGIGRWR